MREHDALWQTSCARRIHQECEVFIRIDLRPPILGGTTDVSDTAEMLESPFWVLGIADQDDMIIWDSDLLRSFPRSVKEWPLRYQQSCSTVGELDTKLFCRIGRIGRRYNPACPMSAPHHCRRVYTIRSKERQDIVLPPLEL